MQEIPCTVTDEICQHCTQQYSQHKQALLKFALSITKSKQTAEDAVQEAFLSLLESHVASFLLPSYEFLILAKTIVRNKCIDSFRKEKYISAKSLDDFEYLIIDETMALEERLIMKSDILIIFGELSVCDRRSQIILAMKYYYGMSYQEIGSALDMTPHHVQTTIYRARKKVDKYVHS